MTREGAERDAPAPSSRSRAPRSRAERAQRMSARDWLGGIRFSAFTAIMLGLVVLAAFVLVPSVGTYLDQRQQIAALQESVRVTEAQVADLEKQKQEWADPAYITSQARERLYYVKPGEVVYLIDDDLDGAVLAPEDAPVSEDVEETRNDWMSQLMRSVATAGVAKTAAVG